MSMICEGEEGGLIIMAMLGSTVSEGLTESRVLQVRRKKARDRGCRAGCLGDPRQVAV